MVAGMAKEIDHMAVADLQMGIRCHIDRSVQLFPNSHNTALGKNRRHINLRFVHHIT